MVSLSQRRTNTPPGVGIPSLSLILALACAVVAGCAGGDRVDADVPVRGLYHPSAEELGARRDALMDAHSDGLIFFAANAEEKAMEQPAWIQAPAFQYFAGLPDVPGAILVVDAVSRSSVLFVPPAPMSFGIPVTRFSAADNPDLVAGKGFDEVLSTSDFVAWMARRLPEVGGRLYLDAPRRPGPSGAPDGMMPVQGQHALWRASLLDAFPDLEVRSAAETVRSLRWVKSKGEITELRQNAVATAHALTAGMRAVGPGVMQRVAEAAVVAGCLEAGANGPSFWPWMMSGPNAQIQNVVGSFFDYRHLNRRMEDGELLRADVGCMGGGYGGDVGRTVPVSGRFTAEQALVWDLLVTGYLAGVDAMAPGVTLDQVREASREAIVRAGSENEEVRDLAEIMASADGVDWHIHGVGIESGETPGGDLEEGVVLAYEPMFVWEDDAYYLEDMILITGDGSEVLSHGLPYSAEEMAAFLRR